MNDLPDLLTLSFLGLPNWKWMSLVAAGFVLYFFRSVVVWACHKIKKAQVHFDEKSFFQFFLEQRIEKPLSWLFISGVALIVVEYLSLPENLAKYLIFFVKFFLTINVIRICYLAAEAFGQTLEEWATHTDNQFDDQLAPFASRTLKVLVVIVGGLVGLQNFGVNVTALLAGLGIGGVALAFAAQDTVSNVFGTITIILDQPFKLGDTIKIGETEGTVTEVGFRSTRIKTYYNSLVSIPNSVMAKEKIDNLSLRDGWIRFRQSVGFTYDTTLEQLNTFSENLRYQIMQDETVDRSRIVVNLNSLGDSSLNVLINFHFQTPTNKSEAQKTNEYLDMILKTAEKNNLAFAFPTRTLILAKADNKILSERI